MKQFYCRRCDTLIKYTAYTEKVDVVDKFDAGRDIRVTRLYFYGNMFSHVMDYYPCGNVYAEKHVIGIGIKDRVYCRECYNNMQ